MVLTQRDKMALGSLVVLLPLMVFLLINNLNRAMSPIATANARGGDQPPDIAGILQSVAQPAARPDGQSLPAQVLSERLKLNAGAPVRNPFNPSSAPRYASQAAVAPATPVAEVRDPVPMVRSNLKTTGIVTSGSKKFAVIGGKLCGEGDVVAGFRIIEVASDHVILGNGEKRYTAYVGKDLPDMSAGQ